MVGQCDTSLYELNLCERTQVRSPLKNQIPHKKVIRTPLSGLNSRTFCFSKLQEGKMRWVTHLIFFFLCHMYNGKNTRSRKSRIEIHFLSQGRNRKMAVHILK